MASACAPPPRSCSAMSSATSIGRGICCASAPCRRAPAASPSSCRCRSCRWRRRSICRAARAAAPTWREAVLMHAVARLALHPLITNIQTSWVKMGREGAAACLAAGANDLGGTLMNESITRAAGAVHGQEMPPEAMEDADPRARPHAAPAHDALRRCRRRAPRRRPSPPRRSPTRSTRRPAATSAIARPPPPTDRTAPPTAIFPYNREISG